MIIEKRKEDFTENDLKLLNILVDKSRFMETMSGECYQIEDDVYSEEEMKTVFKNFLPTYEKGKEVRYLSSPQYVLIEIKEYDFDDIDSAFGEQSYYGDDGICTSRGRFYYKDKMVLWMIDQDSSNGPYSYTVQVLFDVIDLSQVAEIIKNNIEV